MYQITCTEEKFLISQKFKFDFPHRYQGFYQLTQQQLEQEIFNQDVLIINDLEVTEIVYQHNPRLKLIALCSTGYEHIDLKLAQKYAVKVCNVRGYATQSVAEHTIMLMLALSKHTLAYQQSTQNGVWQDSQSFCYIAPHLPIYELSGKTLVILGQGAIGQAVADKARALNMRVIFAERPNARQCRDGYMAFEQAIQVADTLSLHCQLNEETLACIDQHVFHKMKPNSVIVNVSRAGLVHQADLLDALREKKIAGYAADVAIQEPMQLSDPLLDQNLNTLFTPHIAWASQEAQQRLFEMVNENINLNLQGEARHLLTA